MCSTHKVLFSLCISWQRRNRCFVNKASRLTRTSTSLFTCMYLVSTCHFELWRTSCTCHLKSGMMPWVVATSANNGQIVSMWTSLQRWQWKHYKGLSRQEASKLLCYCWHMHVECGSWLLCGRNWSFGIRTNNMSEMWDRSFFLSFPFRKRAPCPQYNCSLSLSLSLPTCLLAYFPSYPLLRTRVPFEVKWRRWMQWANKEEKEGCVFGGVNIRFGLTPTHYPTTHAHIHSLFLSSLALVAQTFVCLLSTAFFLFFSSLLHPSVSNYSIPNDEKEETSNGEPRRTPWFQTHLWTSTTRTR